MVIEHLRSVGHWAERSQRTVLSAPFVEGFCLSEASGRGSAVFSKLMTLALVSVTLLTETGRTVAAEHVVNMLTNGDSGSMVFEPAFVKVAVGDTIVFNPVAPNQFHNSASQFLPEGATSWSSTFDTEFRLTVETEGVYIYSCVPHQGMGMVGVIQVGAATNLAGAKTAAEELSSKMFQNKERLTAALAQAN